MTALTSLWRNLPPVTRAVVLMAVSTVFIAGMHAIIRYVSSELHPIQIAFFRNLFGLLVFIPWFFRYGVEPLRTRRLPMHALRAGLNILAMFSFFYALSIAPIAEVTALGFTAPIFATLLSILLLRERIRFRRWAAIAVGFIGTLVILRPGIQVIEPGALLVLGSALLWGTTLIVIKHLGRTESSITITLYMSLLLALLSFIPALFVWKMPSLETFAWLAVIGISGNIGQIAIAQSLKMADAGVVMPLDFLKLVWASLLGFFLFGEGLDAFVWLGGLIVLASSSYIAYRESRQGKKLVAPPPA